MLCQAVDTVTPCVLSSLLRVSGSTMPDPRAMAGTVLTLANSCSASCGMRLLRNKGGHLTHAAASFSHFNWKWKNPGARRTKPTGSIARRPDAAVVLRALALLPKLRARGSAAAAQDVDEAATARFKTASLNTLGPCTKASR
eukprot:1490181-Amphidinium_carterae.1